MERADGELWLKVLVETNPNRRALIDQVRMRVSKVWEYKLCMVHGYVEVWYMDGFSDNVWAGGMRLVSRNEVPCQACACVEAVVHMPHQGTRQQGCKRSVTRIWPLPHVALAYALYSQTVNDMYYMIMPLPYALDGMQFCVESGVARHYLNEI